jgi:murein DD-endopeptidase MepM/ murein hydrolase activator NlpD
MRIITLLLIMTLSATAINAAPGEKYTYHTVEKGETLYSISKMYGMKPADPAQYNGVSQDKMVIKLGQKLKVPSSSAATEESTPSTSAPAPASSKEEAAPSDKYHVVKKERRFSAYLARIMYLAPTCRHGTICKTSISKWGRS